MGGIAVEGLRTIVAFEGDLFGWGREGGVSISVAIRGGGEFGRAGVEADARDEEAECV